MRQTHFIAAIATIATALLITTAEAATAITAGGLGPACAACIVGACLEATTPCLSGCLASTVGYPVCATACIAMFCSPCVVACACHDVDSTKVTLANGTEVFMAELQVGDSVMTFDKSTSKLTETKVMHINVAREQAESIEITMKGQQTVKVTPSH